MKVGAFVATFIAIGLIAYQHQPSVFGVESKPVEKAFPSLLTIQSQLLTYPLFATVSSVKGTSRSVEIEIPVDSLFLPNSTVLKPEAERQFSELMAYFNGLDATSRFEVTLLGLPDAGFNPKFRSTRARKLADAIKKTGITEDRIDKVWQVLLEPQARLSASADAVQNQYFSVRILTSN